MKVLIFGAGSMGSIFGGFLSSENDVSLIGRKNHVDSINEKGLLVTGIWGEHSFSKLRAFKSVEEVQEDSVFDLIMITTKAYDTEAAVKEIKPFVKGTSVVMSMQNGIGNEETISRAVGVKKTMGGMAIFGGKILEPGHAEVTVFASDCLVGDLNGGLSRRVEQIAESFSSAGIPTKASENIKRDKWMKAFYNIALNPLSAILRVPYGVLGERKESKDLMKSMLKEAFNVAASLDISLKFTWEEYFKYLIEKQLPPTSAHRSSMLQDIERGKKTEIDYLNGAIVRLGQDRGIETPVNETITNIIRALEIS
jgi:2-dehydropantoate 2-reductase